MQIIGAVLNRLVEAREHRVKILVEYASNPNSAMHSYLNGYKIRDTEKEKEERYKIRENLIWIKNEAKSDRNVDCLFLRR